MRCGPAPPKAARRHSSVQLATEMLIYCCLVGSARGQAHGSSSTIIIIVPNGCVAQMAGHSQHHSWGADAVQPPAPHHCEAAAATSPPTASPCCCSLPAHLQNMSKLPCRVRPAAGVARCSMFLLHRWVHKIAIRQGMGSNLQRATSGGSATAAALRVPPGGQLGCKGRLPRDGGQEGGDGAQKNARAPPTQQIN